MLQVQDEEVSKLKGILKDVSTSHEPTKHDKVYTHVKKQTKEEEERNPKPKTCLLNLLVLSKVRIKGRIFYILTNFTWATFRRNFEDFLARVQEKVSKGQHPYCRKTIGV